MAASKTRLASSILTASLTLTLTLTLPSSLPVIVPAMETAVFIRIPSLWNSFLSWLTPTCLFVLLNGIIVILSASSGFFNGSQGTDFYANLLSKAEKQGAALMVESGVTSPFRNSPKRVSKFASPSDCHGITSTRNASPRWNHVDRDLHYVSTNPKAFSFQPIPVHRWSVVSETDEVDEWESSPAFRIKSNPPAISQHHNSSQVTFNHKPIATSSHHAPSSPPNLTKSQSTKRSTENTQPSPSHHAPSSPPKLTKSPSTKRSKENPLPSPKEATTTPRHEPEKDVEASSTPKANKFALKKPLDAINTTNTSTEDAAANYSINTPKKCGSEPSSPHYATSSAKSNNGSTIKRSLSIGSAQDPSRKDDATSDQNLNDDEFRKMIEAFITEKKKKLMRE